MLALTGLLSGATMVAHAQTRIFLGFGGGRGPVISAQYYAPPCPGPGYVWVAGYYNGPYWVPGYWAYREDYYPRSYYVRGYYYHHDHDHWRDRDDDWRGHGWRDYDHHDNGWHRGWDHGHGHDH